ncbi:M48 family metallopeptidase [Chryseolinea lacunae]|uniref:M48 family metallopeptidase n=1 Tax=Chryseolinea lacunae TaxID=2801331 RepID=A0ABS1KUS9_9BACT|nr:M48 family metallopeptidase [Chryseolinea lacunae]MBL0742977.1 M48 family metallopeptidase [Chryseolinea lacunae]
MKGFCLTLLTCLVWGVAVAQFEKNYVPAPLQDTIPPATLATLKAKLAADKARVAEPSKEVSNYIKELYDKRANFVIDQFNEDYILTDETLSPYLQSVLNNIYAANPALPRETKVYAHRSEAVNAMSYGEGTIAFTLGLLSRMETEAQVAFVLCHELAHYHTHHSDLKAAEVARFLFDPETKKKVKEIEKNEFGQYTRLTKLVGSFGMSITRHGRDKEFEADSLALRYYLNTTYDLQAPVRTLEILDSADVEPFRTNLDLRKHFDFKAYPFKERWLTYAPSNTWHANEDADSLHTHPSCTRRIVAIKRQLLTAQGANRKAIDYGTEQSDAMRRRSEFEIAVSRYHFGNYGRGLFLYLALAERYPENAYVHAMIGQGLYQLYWYQKNHELGKVLSLPDARFEENYDRYLSFVHTLRLMELASLSYYYSSTQRERFGVQEDLLYACWLSSKTEVSQSDPGKIKTEYIANFPQGRYLSKMK